MRIMPGGEPFFHPGGRTGCLLLHGFTASPQEVREMGEHLAQAGFTVLGPRLAGHATEVMDMARTRWEDWLASAEDGLHLLSDCCDEIIIMGISMGGVLGLLLGIEFPVRGVLSMAAPYWLPPDPRLKILRPVLRPLSLIIPTLPKGEGDGWYDQEAASRRVAYASRSLFSVVQLDHLLRVFRSRLPLYDKPLALVHSKVDRFIPPENCRHIQQAVASEEVDCTWLEQSNHLVTLDAERYRVFDLALDFALKISAAP